MKYRGTYDQKPRQQSAYLILAVCLHLIAGVAAAQEPVFKCIPFDSFGVKPYKLYTTKEGTTWITSSAGIWRLKGRELNGPNISDGLLYDQAGKVIHQEFRVRDFGAEDSIRGICQAPDNALYYMTHDNFIICRPDGENLGIGWSPLFLNKEAHVANIWIDSSMNFYAGTSDDNFYFLRNGANRETWKGFETGSDESGNFKIDKGKKEFKKIVLGSGIHVNCFAEDQFEKELIWLGTNKGLYGFHSQNESFNPVGETGKFSVTHIYTGETKKIWFSTREMGMGLYDRTSMRFSFFGFPEKPGAYKSSPISGFCYKSPYEFFIVNDDSLPAIFNTKSRQFFFLKDSALQSPPNHTTDLLVDRSGNLLLLKNGRFYISDVSASDLLKAFIKSDSLLFEPFIKSIRLADAAETELANLDYNRERLSSIELGYRQNYLLVYFDISDYTSKDVQFAWKLEGDPENMPWKDNNEWVETFRIKGDNLRFVTLPNLKPGNYALKVRVRVGKENWRNKIAVLHITIKKPYWQELWFWISSIIGVSFLLLAILKIRERRMYKQNLVKSANEKKFFELEAKALRAQMNPHFVFNCLNSIKVLIQDKENEKGIIYLTTFSKLIRTLFNNADKKEITLFDEIETCKYYLQLESMRFDSRFSYSVNVDPQIDLKSITVPALVIQPFIENAIWHGIMPREAGGTVTLSVRSSDRTVEVEIEDDGIGREASRQNKASTGVEHHSKGVSLTEARLKLNNLLNQKDAHVTIIDKKDIHGVPLGTKILITIKEE